MYFPPCPPFYARPRPWKPPGIPRKMSLSAFFQTPRRFPKRPAHRSGGHRISKEIKHKQTAARPTGPRPTRYPDVGRRLPAPATRSLGNVFLSPRNLFKALVNWPCKSKRTEGRQRSMASSQRSSSIQAMDNPATFFPRAHKPSVCPFVEQGAPLSPSDLPRSTGFFVPAGLDSFSARL